MTSKKLRDFYHEYFNGHYFRDIDYIRGKWKSFKDSEPKNQTERLRYKVSHLGNTAEDIVRFKKSARYFLVNKKHRDSLGQLLHYNSYFNIIPDFHSDNRIDRLYDRIFYDIDKHDDTIDGFKNSINEIKARQIGSDVGYTYKQKLRDIKQVQKHYRDYIFQDNFLADPYSDVLKIVEYYNNRGTNPVVSFTGGAGFHINILFEPVHLDNPSDVFLSYNNLITSKTGVTSLDEAPPKNAVKGTQRTPYSVHEKSGLTGFIIPDGTDYDDLLTMIKRNKLQVTDFSYDDHLVPELLREQIIKIDISAGQKKQVKKEQLKKKYNPRPKGSKKIYYNGQLLAVGSHEHSHSLSDDLRVLWDLMVLDGAVEPPKDKDIREHYNRVRCSFPNHEDRTPSAIVGKYRYKCFKCCPDGINWYMLIAVTYGIINPDGINKEIPQDKKSEINKVIKRLQGISSAGVEL